MKVKENSKLIKRLQEGDHLIKSLMDKKYLTLDQALKEVIEKFNEEKIDKREYQNCWCCDEKGNPIWR